MASDETDQDGRFEIDLPTGRYQLTGRSPSYQGGDGICASESEIVVPDETLADVVVTCQRR